MNTTKLDHPELVDLMRRAYSAERAASFAYIGHAGSLKDPKEKEVVKQIEDDEWDHRSNLSVMMKQYDISPSAYYELKYFIIGKIIGYSCYAIGWFMPYFFAGRLESGNVCEYFRMMQYFNSLGITEHDEILYEMGIKEKEHEVIFLDMVKNEPWLPYFEKLFEWGVDHSENDVDLENKLSILESKRYCKSQKKEQAGAHNGEQPKAARGM